MVLKRIPHIFYLLINGLKFFLNFLVFESRSYFLYKCWYSITISVEFLNLFVKEELRSPEFALSIPPLWKDWGKYVNMTYRLQGAVVYNYAYLQTLAKLCKYENRYLIWICKYFKNVYLRFRSYAANVGTFRTFRGSAFVCVSMWKWKLRDSWRMIYSGKYLRNTYIVFFNKRAISLRRALKNNYNVGLRCRIFLIFEGRVISSKYLRKYILVRLRTWYL